VLVPPRSAASTPATAVAWPPQEPELQVVPPSRACQVTLWKSGCVRRTQVSSSQIAAEKPVPVPCRWNTASGVCPRSIAAPSARFCLGRWRPTSSTCASAPRRSTTSGAARATSVRSRVSSSSAPAASTSALTLAMSSGDSSSSSTSIGSLARVSSGPRAPRRPVAVVSRSISARSVVWCAALREASSSSCACARLGSTRRASSTITSRTVMRSGSRILLRTSVRPLCTSSVRSRAMTRSSPTSSLAMTSSALSGAGAQASAPKTSRSVAEVSTLIAPARERVPYQRSATCEASGSRGCHGPYGVTLGPGVPRRSWPQLATSRRGVTRGDQSVRTIALHPTCAAGASRSRRRACGGWRRDTAFLATTTAPGSA
jgi:hypothetical protein